MEKIVYILGAGFSAPLGVPVISNFLIKARDLYFKDKEKYKHFESVLSEISKMHSAMSHFNLDLYNIEEILSILEMMEEVSGCKKQAEEFQQFIKSVIEFHTPTITIQKRYYFNKTDIYHFHPAETNFFLTEIASSYKYYSMFLFKLLQLKIICTHVIDASKQATQVSIEKNISGNSIQYSIITLNYDLVLENILNHFKNIFPKYKELFSIDIVKLHGSVNGTIVTPTWKKWINDTIRKDWSKAYELLKDATQVRILGYSLPTSDNYIKYLLSSSIISSELSLKRIDILCKDDNMNSVKERYKNFIRYYNTRFVNGDIQDYMEKLNNHESIWMDRIKPHEEHFNINYRSIEKEHDDYFSK